MCARTSICPGRSQKSPVSVCLERTEIAVPVKNSISMFAREQHCRLELVKTL
eukprot:COSAG05_NODE_2886_length_2539_cov_8.314344_2_plen_52_part_00